MKLSVVTYFYRGHDPYQAYNVHLWVKAMQIGFKGMDVDLAVVTDMPKPVFDAYGFGARHVEDCAPEELKNAGRCWRRLALWDKDYWPARTFWDRLLLLDLDIVVTGDLKPLVARDEPLVFWQDALASRQPRQFLYNGGMVLMNWGQFPGVVSGSPAKDFIRHTAATGLVGSDQARYGAYFGPGVPVWTDKDGVLSYKFDLVHRNLHKKCPIDARIISFHGRPKPWQVPGWVKSRYFDPTLTIC